jgi:hypothetical protein
MTVTENPQAPAVTPSQRLRQALRLTAMSLDGKHETNLFRHPRIREIYPRYLLTLYPGTRAAIPLIVAACDAVLRAPDHDSPRSRALAAYFAKRIPEEMGHDEWLLEDLERLGVSASEARAHMPSPSAAALAGAQWFYIEHGLPAALLGYMGVLEGFPPIESELRAAAARTGYPLDCFRTLRKHGNLDIHHRDDLNVFLDSAPLTEEDMVLIITNAIATFERAAAMISEVVSGHPMTLLPSERQRHLRQER